MSLRSITTPDEIDACECVILLGEIPSAAEHTQNVTTKIQKHEAC